MAQMIIIENNIKNNSSSIITKRGRNYKCVKIYIIHFNIQITTYIIYKHYKSISYFCKFY